MDVLNTQLRSCGDCKVKRDIEEFTGKNLCCNKCLEKGRRYRAKNPDKVKELWQRYSAENPEEIKAYRKEYNKIEAECDVCKCTVRKNGMVQTYQNKEAS